MVIINNSVNLFRTRIIKFASGFTRGDAKKTESTISGAERAFLWVYQEHGRWMESMVYQHKYVPWKGND